MKDCSNPSETLEGDSYLAESASGGILLYLLGPKTLTFIHVIDTLTNSLL